MAYDFNSLTKQAPEATNRDKFYTDFGDVDPNKLHQISELTNWMRTKAKGSDVREVIAQLFERTWVESIKEGNANLEVAQARGTHPNLRSRLDESDNKQKQTTAQLAEKVNKDEVTNVMTPKGNIAYASLPMTGNSVGWYYYCPDGDGTHGAGNYVWNGTSWFFGGTGDEGYNLLKKDLVDLDNEIRTEIAVNLLDYKKANKNIGWIDFVNHNINPAKIDYRYSDLIPVKIGKKYAYNFTLFDWATYDSNEEWINGGPANSYPTVIPEGVSYIRVCVKGEFPSNSILYEVDNTRINALKNIPSSKTLCDYFYSPMADRNIKVIQNGLFNFNTINKTLECLSNVININFGGNCGNGDIWTKKFISNFPLDLTKGGTITFGFIYYNFLNNELYVSNDTNNRNNFEILLGSYFFDTNCFDFIGNFTVNGKPYVALKTYDLNQIETNKNNIVVLQNRFLPYKDKILSALGDSITEQSYSFWHQLNSLCGFSTLSVDGVGGSCIAEGDTYESKVPMVNRIENLNENADVIYIMGGTNDWGHNIPLGVFGDTQKTTFYGALDYMCKSLLTKYPLKDVFFITPLQRNMNLWPANGQAKGSFINGKGFKLEQYVDAIKEVCAYYSIPVLDLYENTLSGKVDGIASTLYNDGLHPTKNAHNWLAKKVSKFINNVL